MNNKALINSFVWPFGMKVVKEGRELSKRL